MQYITPDIICTVQLNRALLSFSERLYPLSKPLYFTAVLLRVVLLAPGPRFFLPETAGEPTVILENGQLSSVCLHADQSRFSLLSHYWWLFYDRKKRGWGGGWDIISYSRESETFCYEITTADRSMWSVFLFLKVVYCFICCVRFTLWYKNVTKVW